MKEEIEKWVSKADGDLKVAKDEIKTENPATDAICFHAQQCVEKYLKAYLVLHKKEFRKTHNLAELLSLCAAIDKNFDELKSLKVQELTIYATELRYPEYFYTPARKEAEEAIEVAEKVKSFVLRKIK